MSLWKWPFRQGERSSESPIDVDGLPAALESARADSWSSGEPLNKRLDNTPLALPRIFLMGATPGFSASQAAAIEAAEDRTAARLAATGGNTGNQIIAAGLLKSLAYSALEWDYSIGPERVDEEFDIIVIAAANFLHSGFDFSGMATFIEKTKLPCVMVGVGAQSSTYSPNIILQPGTERLMRLVAERSKLIGARGPFSAEVLANLGIHNVQVTGCPSYYWHGQAPLQINKKPLRSDSKLLINSSRDVVSHAFNREVMIKVVSRLWETAISCNADFAIQSELPEARIADASSEAVIEANVRQILQDFPFFKDIAPKSDISRWCSEHLQVFWEVEPWFRAMSHYDFVFGNRFHGAMIALQAGTPAVVICHDTRTAEMCKFLEIPHISLQDAFNFELSNLYNCVDADRVRRRSNELKPLFRDFLVRNGLALSSTWT